MRARTLKASGERGRRGVGEGRVDRLVLRHSDAVGRHVVRNVLGLGHGHRDCHVLRVRHRHGVGDRHGDGHVDAICAP